MKTTKANPTPRTSYAMGRALLLVMALLLVSAVGARSQNYVYEELHAFAADTNGYGPKGALVQGADGYFYGTCAEGGQPSTNCGACGYGTVFKISTNGALNTLAWFNYPYGYSFGQMVQATDGNFYGDSEHGLFRVTPDGVLTARGGGTLGDPIQGTNGYLYSGNPYYGLVAWYSLDGHTVGVAYPQGTPSGGLIQATDGNFYGLTSDGGAHGMGTAYRLTPDGVLTTFASFGPGSNPPFWPYGKLLQASDGNLYGVADSESGQVFRLTLDGTLTNLAWFGVGDAIGQAPNGGLIEADDGNFYGTTFGGGTNPGAQGTAFKMSPQGRISTLIDFSYRGAYPGSGPLAGLVQGTDGNLYGTCAYGGTYGGGNIFRIIMPGPQLTLTQAGQQMVLSWRTNYTGFTLQSATDLALANWIGCTNSPVAQGRYYFATNPISAGPCFFRLKK